MGNVSADDETQPGWSTCPRAVQQEWQRLGLPQPRTRGCRGTVATESSAAVSTALVGGEGGGGQDLSVPAHIPVSRWDLLLRSLTVILRRLGFGGSANFSSNVIVGKKMFLTEKSQEEHWLWAFRGCQPPVSAVILATSADFLQRLLKLVSTTVSKC